MLPIKQDQDIEICKIHDRLEKDEDKLYELRDDLVYRKINKNKLLLYMSEVMENIICTYCDDIGHVGASKVSRIL